MRAIFKTVQVIVLLLAAKQSFANAEIKTQVFVLDESEYSKEELPSIKEMCTTEYTLKETDDLAAAVLGSPRSDYKILKIQSTKGSLINPKVGEYSGEYLTRVYLTTVTGISVYPLGVWSRVEIHQLGIGKNRVSFIVTNEPINHLESAEVTEGSICRKLAYKLQK